MRQTPETPEEQEQTLALAEQVAALLEQLDAFQPGSVRAAAGRIAGPGLEIRNVSGRWTVSVQR